MSKLFTSVLITFAFLYLFPGCLSSITYVNTGNQSEGAISQSAERFNEETKGKTMRVRLKDGKELIAKNVHLQPDSTSYELADVHQRETIPNDSLLEIVNSDFNFSVIPKPTIIGALVGALSIGVFRPTYNDENGVEQRVSIARGFMYGGFFGLMIGMIPSAGTVYRLRDESAP